MQSCWPAEPTEGSRRKYSTLNCMFMCIPHELKTVCTVYVHLLAFSLSEREEFGFKGSLWVPTFILKTNHAKLLACWAHRRLEESTVHWIACFYLYPELKTVCTVYVHLVAFSLTEREGFGFKGNIRVPTLILKTNHTKLLACWAQRRL